MKLGIALAGLSSINILLAFVQLWYVVTHLGPGIQTDSLYAGMVVPQLVLAVVSGALMHVLVPLLAADDAAHSQADAWGFLIAVTGVFAVAALVLATLAPWWAPAIVPGFSPEAKELTIRLTRIQLIGMVLTATVSVLWSISHAKRRFIWAESSPVAANALAFAFLVWALPRYGVAAAAWSYVVAAALQVLFLVSNAGSPRRPDWKSAAMVDAKRRLKPLLIGTIYFKTDPAVDRFLASMAPAGRLSLLHIGSQLLGAVNQVVNKAIAAPMVPSLAAFAGRQDWRSFHSLYKQRLHLTLWIVVPGYLAFLALGERILDLLIGYGGVTNNDVHLLWWIMGALGGTLIGGAIGNITSVAFFARGDTRTPTRIGIWTYTIYVPAKVLVFFSFGVLGLAVSTSIFVTVNAVLQYITLEKQSATYGSIR